MDMKFEYMFLLPNAQGIVPLGKVLWNIEKKYLDWLSSPGKEEENTRTMGKLNL